jgi:flavorubredoxin
MWGSTEALARSILQGLAGAGVPARLLHLRSNHRSDVIAEMLEARGVLLGSPTLNNGMFPTMADFLAYMKGLRPIGKLFGLFGSHGWGGGGVKEMKKLLEEARFSLWDRQIEIQFHPDDGELTKACQFGNDFGRKVLEGWLP